MSSNCRSAGAAKSCVCFFVFPEKNQAESWKFCQFFSSLPPLSFLSQEVLCRQLLVLLTTSSKSFPLFLSIQHIFHSTCSLKQTYYTNTWMDLYTKNTLQLNSVAECHAQVSFCLLLNEQRQWNTVYLLY